MNAVTTRRRGVRPAVAGIGIAILAVACAPTPPALPTDPAPPVISRFSAVVQRSESPVTAVLGWTISDPNGDPLTCRVDLDGNGTIDRIVPGCTNADSVLEDFTDPGLHTVTLEVTDGTTAAAIASTVVTVAPGPAEPFDITLQLPAGMAPEYAAAFEAAADRWEEVIVAGWPAQPLTVPAGFLGWMPAFDGIADDVVIAARDLEIDGPGKVLGSAGTLLYRDTGQPLLGIMQFDTADLQRLADLDRLGDVILHEMGHVLGIGSNWVVEGRIDDLLADPRYNGPAGKAAWRELGGSGSVPVENQGGSGTALAHWRESTFDTELMTGYSDGDERLSRLTIAAMADRGYGVDLGAADPYELPTLGAALRSAEDHHHHADGTDHDLPDVGHTDPIAPFPGERLPGT